MTVTRSAVLLFALSVSVLAAPDAEAQLIQNPGNSVPVLQPGTLERSTVLEARRLAASRAPQGAGNAQTAPQRSWAGRHPILLGSFIGLGFGLGDEAIRCATGVEVVPHSGEGLPCDARVGAAIGGLSAGIGAGVGAVAAIVLR